MFCFLQLEEKNKNKSSFTLDKKYLMQILIQLHSIYINPMSNFMSHNLLTIYFKIYQNAIVCFFRYNSQILSFL